MHPVENAFEGAFAYTLECSDDSRAAACGTFGTFYSHCASDTGARCFRSAHYCSGTCGGGTCGCSSCIGFQAAVFSRFFAAPSSFESYSHACRIPHVVGARRFQRAQPESSQGCSRACAKPSVELTPCAVVSSGWLASDAFASLAASSSRV
jgi:hypothetical protein